MFMTVAFTSLPSRFPTRITAVLYVYRALPILSLCFTLLSVLSQVFSSVLLSMFTLPARPPAVFATAHSFSPPLSFRRSQHYITISSHHTYMDH
jgi:hypothetical protein